MGFEGGTGVKNLPTNAGDAGDKRRGFDPWVGKNFWSRKGNPLQFLAWKILWTGTWQVTVRDVKESESIECTHTYTYIEKYVY